MRNGMVESKWLPVLILILVVLSAGCSAWARIQEGGSESPAAQTPRGVGEARQCASEWVTEASQTIPTFETWQGAGLGEPTAYTGSGGPQSVLVFPVIKDDEEVGYVTIDAQAGRCAPLGSGLGPPPSRNLPEAREMAVERLGTTADDLDLRLVHLEPMTYLAELTGPGGEEITFNLQSLREYPESQ